MATYNSINSNVQGNNTFLGSGAGNITLTGDFNIGIGSDTLNSLTAGLENVGVGYNVLTAATAAQHNVCIGNITGTAITIGSENTIVGSGSGAFLTTGTHNTLLGYLVGSNYTTVETRNLIIGSGFSGTALDTDKFFIGFIDGIGNISFAHNIGTNNTFLGANAGNIAMGAATNNAGLGFEALKVVTTGDFNTAIGSSALKALTTGTDNTALGADALNALVTGNKNLALGSTAGNAYTGAESSNICIGNVGVLGESNVIRLGTDGVGLGQQSACFTAGALTSARDITATTGNISSSAGQVNAFTTMTAGTGITATTGNIVATAGQVNAGTTMTAGTGITSTTGNIVATAGQVNAGTTMTAGTGITATTGDIVATAGAVNAGTTVTAGTGVTATTGNITATAGNVVITAGNLNLPVTSTTQGIITLAGAGSPWIHAFGTDNFFAGKAGNLTTSGLGNNTGVGVNSLNGIDTGYRNTATGRDSGKVISTGLRNSYFGFGSGINMQTGEGNTAVGQGAGSGITTGSWNTAIGVVSAAAGAGSSHTLADSSNIEIGNVGVAGTSNQIRIGTTGGGAGQQNKCFIAGTTGVTPDTADAKLMIMDSAGQMGTLGAATNGQIAIGSTGANPVLAALTAGSGISITNGAGSISIATSASTCSFSAYLAADDPNVTGNGTDYQLGTATAFTEVFDTGTNFNTNGTFTAPTTGVYALNAQVVCTGCTIATTFELTIVTTTRTYITKFMRPASADDYTIGTTVLADMTATNTAVVKIKVSGEAGDTVDLASANTGCRFSGNRLY